MMWGKWNFSRARPRSRVKLRVREKGNGKVTAGMHSSRLEDQRDPVDRFLLGMGDLF